jgi:hypothetical protein
MTPQTLANVGSAAKVIGGVSLLHVFEHLGASRNPDEQLSADVDKVTRGYYSDFLATTLKSTVGDGFTVTCNATETPGAAQMFDNSVDRNGYLYSSKPWGGCSTQGGNWTSVDDFGKFFVALQNSAGTPERDAATIGHGSMDPQGAGVSDGGEPRGFGNGRGPCPRVLDSVGSRFASNA